MASIRKRLQVRSAGMVVFATILLLALGACQVTGTNSVDSGEAKQHRVSIIDFKFQPATLTVSAGDTVTFTNQDIVPHTATAMDNTWDSGSLAKDASYTLAIDKDTTLQYYCVFHPMMKAGMAFN